MQTARLWIASIASVWYCISNTWPSTGCRIRRSYLHTT